MRGEKIGLNQILMGRNFYKGVFGDNINVMLAAAAYNFKRAMRLLLRLLEMAIYWAKNLGTATKSMDFATAPICLWFSKPPF